MEWFKLYGPDYLSDPKIQQLTGEERSVWITLLCLASTSNIEGVILHANAWSIFNMSGVYVHKEHSQLMDKLQSLEMIKLLDNGSIEITNWNKRQEKTMTPYERVKKHRTLKKKDDNAMITDNVIEKTLTPGWVKEVDWLNKEKWEEWELHRKEIKHKLTDSMRKRQISFLRGFISQHEESIEESIKNGWRGLFEPKRGNRAKNVITENVESIKSKLKDKANQNT